MTSASALAASLAAAALFLAGCGSSATGAAPTTAPVVAAPMASTPALASPASAELPAGPDDASWKCANDGSNVTCVCEGTAGACKGSVAKPSQVKGATGRVRWFNDSNGFGFIAPDDGEADIFAHFSAINMPGFKTLKEGQCVQFDVTNGPKGKQASNIQAGVC